MIPLQVVSDLNPADSLAEDSVLNTESSTSYGLVLSKEPEMPPPPRRESSFGQSVIFLVLFAVFFAICFRIRNNIKFLGALKRNLFEVKERSNLFDDTVRETSFLILLNLMWCVSAGVMLFRLIQTSGRISSPEIAVGTGICIGIAIIYTLFMFTACFTIGSIFSDTSHSRIWIKGFVASQGIMGFIYFPLALAFLCYPAATVPLLWIAALLYIAIRSLFIFKGFRIFFTHSSSWVLFLYYLCSLEIVPLILAYALAAYLCAL